jgi:hypothetical protein
MDALRRRAGVLEIDILGRDLHVVHGGFDIGVSHQLHKRRQADAGAHHIGGERVSAIPNAELSPLFRAPDYY